MTLPASGSITIQMIATELGLSLPLELGSAPVRSLAGVPSGNITMPADFYGKSAADQIPDAVAWNDVSCSGGFHSSSANNNLQTITGINTAITLRISMTSPSFFNDPIGSGSVTLDVMKNGSLAHQFSLQNAASNTEISVSSGDTINFYVAAATSPTGLQPPTECSVSASATFTMRNMSSGATVLDSFVASGSTSGPNS